MNREYYNKLLEGVDSWNAYSRQQREIDENWYADLSGADLQNADFRGFDLRGASFFKANLSGANFRNADLTEVNFWRADLRVADLRSSNFGGTNLINVNFNGVNLREVNLSGTNLFCAIFNDSDIKKIPNFHRIQLDLYICYIQPDWLQIGCWCGTPDELRNATESEAGAIGREYAVDWLREYRRTVLQICEGMKK